jgi:hypothetical protein
MVNHFSLIIVSHLIRLGEGTDRNCQALYVDILSLFVIIVHRVAIILVVSLGITQSLFELPALHK